MSLCTSCCISAASAIRTHMLPVPSATAASKCSATTSRAALVPAAALVNHGLVQSNEEPEGWTEVTLSTGSRATSPLARSSSSAGCSCSAGPQHASMRAFKRRSSRGRNDTAPSARRRKATAAARYGRRRLGPSLHRNRARCVQEPRHYRLWDVSEYLRVRVPQIGAVQERLTLGAGE